MLRIIHRKSPLEYENITRPLNLKIIGLREEVRFRPAVRIGVNNSMLNAADKKRAGALMSARTKQLHLKTFAITRNSRIRRFLRH
jgi:hypothetical protein